MNKQKYQLEEERRIKELEQARDFQMSLIPQTPPEHPDYDIALQSLYDEFVSMIEKN